MAQLERVRRFGIGGERLESQGLVEFGRFLRIRSKSHKLKSTSSVRNEMVNHESAHAKPPKLRNDVDMPEASDRLRLRVWIQVEPADGNNPRVATCLDETLALSREAVGSIGPIGD